MKLIDLLELFREPNPSGYVEIINSDNIVIRSTAAQLLDDLRDTTLNKTVDHAVLATLASTFPVLKIYIKEETTGDE